MGNLSDGLLYDYYHNDNLKTDRSKDLFFYHNLINLPILVKTTSGQSKQRYTYLADGTKLRTRDNWQIGFNYRGKYCRDNKGFPQSLFTVL